MTLEKAYCLAKDNKLSAGWEATQHILYKCSHFFSNPEEKKAQQVQTVTAGVQTAEKEWATRSHALSTHIGAKRTHDVIRHLVYTRGTFCSEH